MPSIASSIKSGTISLSLDASSANSLNPTTYCITCNGPNSKVVTRTTSETDASFTDIAPGNWAISVQAKDSAATTVGKGSATLSVLSGETAVSTVSITAVALSPSPSLGSGVFTFGVWSQNPLQQRNGRNNTLNFKDIGINTFVGLARWPSENWAYPGYSLACATALQVADMKVIAGSAEDPSLRDSSAASGFTGLQWNLAHPEFASTFTGYQLGDEPDMNNTNSINTPDYWVSLGAAIRASDTTRDIYTNFGKPFAIPVTYYKPIGASKAADFAKYISPNTIVSCDYYGITDPYEAQSSHGVWTYGRAIANIKQYALSRQIWGFVEASAPWHDNDGTEANKLYDRMPAALIMPIVWNMVIQGATGIIYFCHDFSSAGLGYDAALVEPGMPAAIKAANASVLAFSAVLNTADIAGTTVTTDGAVDVITLTKRFNGVTYIFSMGNGNSSYIGGQAVNAAFTFSGASTTNVTVQTEGRTLTMTDGKSSDHFDAYQVHIYSF
jgi:hypothetical protein